jgi:DNA-directed RNA polymerase subunit M/transcription elongation factor TFIIS
MYRIQCPNCGHRLKYGDEHVGKKAKCQKCKEQLLLPAADVLADVRVTSMPAKPSEDQQRKDTQPHARSNSAPAPPHLSRSGSGFVFPAKCSKCYNGKPAGFWEVSQTVTTQYTDSLVTKTYTARVPVCENCLTKLQSEFKMAVQIGIPLGLLVSVIVCFICIWFGSDGKLDISVTNVVLILLAFVLIPMGIVGLLTWSSSTLAIASLSEGGTRLRFFNKRYQSEFETLNKPEQRDRS